MINKIFAAAADPLNIMGGTIAPPAKILEGSPVSLLNTFLKLIFLVAGIYTFWNFIVAGYKLISGGDNPESVGAAWGTIWKSLLGLLIIVISFVFAALVGWLFFGDATILLNPKMPTS